MAFLYLRIETSTVKYAQMKIQSLEDDEKMINTLLAVQHKYFHKRCDILYQGISNDKVSSS